MYNYITGIIKEIGTNFVVIENNNIGYQIYVGNPYVYRENLEYTIYLYNYIREDEYTLYAEGSAIVTEQNFTWVLATNSTGSYSTPKGMSIEDLLKPFKKEKYERSCRSM